MALSNLESDLMSQSPVPRRSRLESLPAEIIEIIFLYCHEINLPRASIHIARTLSHELIYTWIIRLAFSNANEDSTPKFFTSDFLPPPLDFFALSAQERSELQTKVLECRWCTLPLIRKCQKEYVEHAIRQKCMHMEFSDEDRNVISNLESRFENLAESDNARNGRRGKGDLVLKGHTQILNGDYIFKVAIWFHFGALQVRKPNDVYIRDNIFRLPACSTDFPAYIPDRLLCGPWTKDKVDFLSLLSMDAYIDEDSTHSRSKRVLRDLIRTRDFATFERFLNQHIRTKEYKFPIRWPVLPSHFRTAIKCADQNGDPFVKLLFDQRWGDIPVNDIQLKNELLMKAGSTSA